MNELKWYCFGQNNTGGFFITDDKVCHRVYIEAVSFRKAVEKAEELGCYCDGVSSGRDCSCCGDRWSKWNDDPIDLNGIQNTIFEADVFDGCYSDTVAKWNEMYGEFEIIEQPKFVKKWGKRYTGKIKIHTLEQYVQYNANKYGWTSPDARLYYANGNVTEIFSKREI